jgi:predicted metalloprotease with PDZ domain
LTYVAWDSPAFKAGLSVGDQIMAVDGEAYDADGLKDAITAAKTSTGPIRLLVKDKNLFATVAVDYHDGLRYPHLTQVPGRPPVLDAILAPRRRSPGR